VERNATASAVAEFIGGGLEITTSLSGAEAWSAGKQLGTTPLSFVDLKPGDFDLELRLKGHESAQRRGKVVSKETVSVAVTLEEIRGSQAGSRYEIEGLGIELVPIAAGSFQMGSPSGESGRVSGETPHRVTISKAYWLGATEVTQGQ
jgi:formylglycine-generating enzyme required for sulfatase activity